MLTKNETTSILWEEKEIPSVQIDLSPAIKGGRYSPSLTEHTRLLEEEIRKLIPQKTWGEGKESFEAWKEENLPIFTWNVGNFTPGVLTVTLLCPPLKAINTEEFFLTAIRKWLNPGKEVVILEIKQTKFHFGKYDPETLFYSSARLLVRDGSELRAFEMNLPYFAKEIKNSILSPKYAKFLLEEKGVSFDQKISFAYFDLINLSHKFEKSFDPELFVELNRVTALTPPEFRERRPYRQLVRLALSQYFVRKQLFQATQNMSKMRHAFLRIIPTQINFPFGSKKTLGLCIGINLFNKHELFEKKHILLAVQKFLPEAQVVKDSFFSFSPAEDLHILYLEIEKGEDESPISAEVIHELKHHLVQELKERVEKLTPVIFAARNEEEVMKNIFVLSQEITEPHDLPQVTISFDNQTTSELQFTIVVVRAREKNTPTLPTLLKTIQKECKITYDRDQIVGYLGKGCPKEAYVFTIELEKDPFFLRSDSSVNFYTARQKVMQLLTTALGEVRDFNGGMIVKQSELLSELKLKFASFAEKHPEVLESFFFSLTPIETQATINPGVLGALFSLFENNLNLPPYSPIFSDDGKKAYALISTYDETFRESLLSKLEKRKISSRRLILNSFAFQGKEFLGFIFSSSNPIKREHFLEEVSKILTEQIEKLHQIKRLEIAFSSLPTSLDPRLGVNAFSRYTIALLFEALMRKTKSGEIIPGIAKSVSVSRDKRTYVFSLRKSIWSNGDPLTAEDFAYALRKILSPHFKSSIKYLFFIIKNAKSVLAKEKGIHSLGIRVIDPYTLEIELENPAPYFLELVAEYFYPINKKLDEQRPNWSIHDAPLFISNGPYKLKKQSLRGSIEIVENPSYWKKNNEAIHQIILTALPPFESTPNRKKEFSSSLSFFGDLIAPTQWAIINTEQFPFNQKKLRQALSLAIDRTKFQLAIPDFDVQPAVTPLPLENSKLQNPIQNRCDKKRAKELFDATLNELGLTADIFTPLRIIAPETALIKHTVQVIKEEWETLFNIPVIPTFYHGDIFSTKFQQRDFQVALMAWFSPINDPIYTLGYFNFGNADSSDVDSNANTYRELLLQSNKEVDIEKRNAYLIRAEKQLLEETPVIPLYYYQDSLIHKSTFLDPA